jgi:hypothetical protein
VPRVALLVFAALVACLVPRAAHAGADGAATDRAKLEELARGPDDRAAADALYFLGLQDDEALHFDDALAHYQASAARLASGRYTPRANTRVTDLRQHAEGGFAPLVRLETVRRSPALSNDPAQIDALVRDALAFPPGKSRVEARMLASEAYLGRLHRQEDALPLLRLVLDDPKADALTMREAASELFTSYLGAKRFDDALTLAHAYPKLLETNAERKVLRLRRRTPIRLAAIAVLALLVLFAMAAFARPSRELALGAVRRLAPMALVFAALASGVGGVLASRYEQTSPYPFTAMGPAIFAIALLARAWSASGSERREARVLRAVVSFAGVFAAAFLMLDRMDPIYLQGFGL